MTTSPTLLTRIRTWLRSDMKVLRWVFLALYIALIVGLSQRFFANGNAWMLPKIITVMLVSQALFIFGSGTIQLCHPIRKRRLWMPILVALFMLTVLLIGLSMALAELFDQTVNQIIHQNSQYIGIACWAFIVCNWIFWGTLLWLKGKQWPRVKTMSRLTGLIFAGSLAELLAAVPSHIIVSRRPGCFVGMFTMLGICAGIYVMIFSFGPGIVLLFLRPRYRREQMEAAPVCIQCQYDLRGSLAAGSTACPECGSTIPETVRL